MTTYASIITEHILLYRCFVSLFFPNKYWNGNSEAKAELLLEMIDIALIPAFTEAWF